MVALGEASELACILRTVVKEQVGDSKDIALMFSGGLDSAILAIIARKYCDLSLYTVGLKGSHDIEWGEECARILDLPFTGIIVQDSDVAGSLERVVRVHGMANPRWMSTFVSFDFALSRISEDKVMCGQAADELFGGYRKYIGTPEAEGMMASDTAELLNDEWPAYRAMGNNYEKTLLAPYLDGRVIGFAESLPAELKISDSGNKLVLRKAAKYLGVPGMMALRRKKAMQYGSGISKAIKHHLDGLGTNLSDLIKSYDVRVE